MNAWIFDLDGVVTDLTKKKITNPHIISSMTHFLQKGEPVTINTGRSLDFIRQEVLTPLLTHLIEQKLPENLLHNFFAVGEKGNAWIEDEKDRFDMATAVPEEFAKKVKALVEKDFSDTMSYDNIKHTMITLETYTGHPIEEFTFSKEKLIPVLEKMMQESGLSQDFKIDPSISAVDIEHKTAGKDKGTKRIISWLEGRNITPDHIVAFGDSNADLGTGEALLELGKNFTFVFVGDSRLIKNQPSFPILFTKEKYDKGVIEYLGKDNLPA